MEPIFIFEMKKHRYINTDTRKPSKTHKTHKTHDVKRDKKYN